MLTMVGGKVVYAAGAFASHDAPLPPAMPDWSPVRPYGGYAGWGSAQSGAGVPLQRAAAQSCGVRERLRRARPRTCAGLVEQCARGRFQELLGSARLRLLGSLAWPASEHRRPLAA
ncbi:MAG: hypothetical protein WDN04_05520 [Rhodospirillales bacterium]